MTPDPRIVRQLKKIDADLSVEWVPSVQRWGVFHAIQMPGRYDESVDYAARAFQAESARQGHLFALADCMMAARQAIHAGQLVCYVTEEDGSYAPLDQRIVTKLQRMDWLRRHCGLREWRQMLKAMGDVRREQMVKEQDEVWDAYRRDPVLARMIQDVLFGQKPSRSVIVPRSYQQGVS